MPYLETVTDISPENLSRYDAIIDVRSPAEFADEPVAAGGVRALHGQGQRIVGFNEFIEVASDLQVIGNFLQVLLATRTTVQVRLHGGLAVIGQRAVQ